MPASSLLTCPLRSPDLAQQTTELGHVLGAVRRARDFGGAISDQQRCVADTAGGRRYSSSVMAPAQRYEKRAFRAPSAESKILRPWRSQLPN